MSRFLMTTILAAGMGLSLGLSLPALAQDEGRALSGQLTYLPRIALPETAEVLVTVEGAFGATLGEARFDSAGAQVPLPFSVDVVPDLNGTLTALIRVEGAPMWIAQDVPLAAGSGPVDLGMIRLEQFSPLAVATEFDCGGTAVAFGIAQDKAVLRVGDRDFEMEEAIAASGARYVAIGDESTEFWSKGDSAMLTVEGQKMGDCTLLDPAPGSYGAGGNEPGWSVSIGESTVEIDADYGALRLSAERPAVQVQPGIYVFDMPGIAARLTLEDRLCADASTGMPHPHRATLMLGERELTGCGGDPIGLLTGADWTIVDIGGAVPVQGAETVLGFGPGGRAYGSTGCNRFFGGYSLTGEGLRMSQMGVTMMACPEPLMTQERAVLDALGAVSRFEIDDSGALLLIGGPADAPLLTARRD